MEEVNLREEVNLGEEDTVKREVTWRLGCKVWGVLEMTLDVEYSHT